MQGRIFAGRTAVITGAGAGMGREHALLLGRLGAQVVVNDLAPTAQDVVDAIVADGGTAVVSRHDVSDRGQAGELVKTALDTFGGLHVVVSNAGIIRNIPFAEMTAADFDKVMKVNAYGAFNVLNAAWPHLLAQGYGRVVMVSSSSAWVSQPLIAQYAASKGAVLGLAKTLAEEGKDHGITVNVVAPGAFTQMAAAMEDENARKQMEAMMAPALVAPAIAWLTREDNTFNGRIFEVAAGRVAENFVGSTRGYWNKELTVEDLEAHTDEVTARDGFRVIGTTVELSDWMTTANTGWAAELGAS
jgi:NAD(P)-dependent dehydrogenase (short-subunit alcohol dehydrogenase family)